MGAILARLAFHKFHSIELYLSKIATRLAATLLIAAVKIMTRCNKIHCYTKCFWELLLSCYCVVCEA